MMQGTLKCENRGSMIPKLAISGTSSQLEDPLSEVHLPHNVKPEQSLVCLANQSQCSPHRSQNHGDIKKTELTETPELFITRKE